MPISDPSDALPWHAMPSSDPRTEKLFCRHLVSALALWTRTRAPEAHTRRTIELEQ